MLIFRPLLLNTNGAQKKNLFQHIVKEPADNHHHKVIFCLNSVLYLFSNQILLQQYFMHSYLQSSVNNNLSAHPPALSNHDIFYYLV